MANKDLRDWISGVEAAGELKTIKGAETKEDRRHRRYLSAKDGQSRGDVRRGARLPQRPPRDRQHPHLGAAHQRRAWPAAPGSEMELIQWWRNYMKHATSHPTKGQRRSAARQRVRRQGRQHRQIPTPVWHEHDGGPFIGTACMVVMKDPDSGWVNYGCLPRSEPGPDVATVMMSPGKHGRIIMGKYHDRDQPCPVAVVVGMHPALFMLARPRNPLRQEARSRPPAASSASRSKCSTCRRPGLPVPANAEIAFEGFIHPDDEMQEGPLGEWTGYYASPAAGSRARHPHRHDHASQ